MTEQNAIEHLKIDKELLERDYYSPSYGKEFDIAIEALKKQIPKKVYHFLEDDTFETTCCGIDVSNKDYKYCPECGCLLGEVEEVEERK